MEPDAVGVVRPTAEEKGHVVTQGATPWIHPFWRVERVTDPADERANMTLQAKVAKNGCKVPCLVNTRKLATGEPLVWLCAAGPAAAPAKAAKKPPTKSDSARVPKPAKAPMAGKPPPKKTAK